MKRWRLFILNLLILNFELSFAQLPYGYAPMGVGLEELSALGGGKNEFVQGMVLFDPTTDPALGRMKGMSIRGVRCYLCADYKQKRQKRSGILASTGTIGNLVRTTYADLSEGWNDVLFDEPLVIGEEKLYLGIQAYETIGTPYPLIAYAAATVPQSCWVNLGKTTWQEFSDRGSLLIFALLDDEAADLIGQTAYAQNTFHPQTVAPEADFEGGLYVHNFTSEPIQSIEIAMQGEGAETPTLRTIELSEPIPAYGGTVVTTMLRSGKTEGTSVGWTATVTKINGAEAQPGRPGTTPLYVTFDNFIRTPLIEEFTSQRCINCPQMAYFLEKALEAHQGDYVYVAHHSGFMEDKFTTQPDREILYVFGGYENEYNPAIMYNRAILEGENQIIQGVRDMSPEPYEQALALAADMPAMAEVNIESAGGQVTVSGRVARDLVGTPLYLSCYLVEDGISTDSYPQLGLDDEDAPSDLKDVFRHNGVILHYFTAEAIGDLLPTETNGSYSVTYPMVEKAGFGGTSRRLVAFVHKVNKSNPYDTYVLNAAEKRLDDEDGIREIQNSKFNDDGEIVNRKSSNSTCYDLQGRQIVNQKSSNGTPPAPEHQLERKKLQKGLYIINGRKVIIGSN